jgi:glutamyl-tRNA synthetase
MDIILKWALKNAMDHKGKAIAGSVIPKVMGEKPGLKKDMKKLVKDISETVRKVNKMPFEEQVKKLEQMAPELLEKKEISQGLPELPKVGKKVVMRMAPYPSGPLHIGNARMVILNDEYVKRYEGELLLVIDDTIGSKDKVPIPGGDEMIIDGLKWLGVNYSKVFYKSDRMELFYKKAEEMIRDGFAYVCECRSGELRENRERGLGCRHREQDVRTNLEKWEKMLRDKYKEGGAVVRLKTDMKHKNPAFRDRVLLRISKSKHPKTGNKYHIWPMLEFSWAVDDLELGVTHVLRGKDLVIEDDMENYIWDLYKKKERPVFVHYGLLKLETGESASAKVSKTKARKMITEGKYSGWDDPRIWSLQSLKRRGIRAEAVREFIKSMGMSLVDVTVPVEILYSKNRDMIDKEANRYFFIKDPVRINVLKAPKGLLAEVPIHPDRDGFRRFEFKDELTVLVERDDLASMKKEKIVRLKDLANVEYSKNTVVYSKDQETVYKIKKIHWLPEKGNMDAHVLMPNGEWIKGMAERHCKNLKEEQIVQFERFGFCRVESSNPLKLVYGHR